MICSKCETSLPDSANFCFFCGKPTHAGTRDATLFTFDLTASLSGRRLVAKTDSERIAETVFSDLERILSRKESIRKSKEDGVWTVTYQAVPDGYDDLQMSRFFQHWKDYCTAREWTPAKPPSHAEGDLVFRFVLKT